MGSKKVAGEFRLFKPLLHRQLLASRQIPNRWSGLQQGALSNGHSIVRREFSVFNVLSQRINGGNHESPQSFKAIKERAQELKGMKEDLNARTILTRNQLYKHADRVMMGSEAKAKVKESFGFAKKYHTESNGDGLKGVKPVDMVKKDDDTVNELKDNPVKGNGMHHVSYLRPLSPHLSIYKPQETSLSSISFRISGIVLVTAVLAFYLVYMKIGLICFTSEYVYQMMFYFSKLIPISAMLLALALSYHIYHGVPHILPWFTRFKKA